MSPRDAERAAGGKRRRGGGGHEGGGIGNSNTTAIKLNNEESGRSKYEHGYDLRPRKPVHNE